MSAGAMKSVSGFCAESLAEQVSACNQPRQDAKATARAKTAVIHAFGQVLAGAPAAVTKSLLDTPGVAMSGGPSLVFGTERRTSAVDAALINATAAAGSETLQDAASAAYIVSLFGLCEERKKTGKEFVDALMFGAEMAVSFASTFPGSDPKAATGQFRSAVFGGIAAASRVLKLSRPRIAAALLMGGVANVGGLPAGQAGLSGLMIGLGMKNALLAAVLAEAMDETAWDGMTRSDGAAGKEAPAESAYDLLAFQSSPAANLWDQFERQAGAVLPRDQIAPLFERLETIDKVNDLATVSRLLQGRSTQNATTKIVFAPRGTHDPEETTWVP